VAAASALRTGTGAAALAGLERHPGAERAGHQARPAQHGRDRGAPGRPARLGHAGRATRAAGQPPGHRHHQGHRGEHGDRQSHGKHREVRLDARIRLGQPGRADRHHRRGHDRQDHAQQRAAGGHRGRPGQGQPEQQPGGHAQGAQRAELGRVQDELAGEQRAEHGQREQASQRGEQGQGGRRRADGPLGGGLLDGQVHEAEAAGRPVVPGQRGGRGAECGRAGAWAQPHVGGVSRPERAPGAAVPEGRAEQHPGRAGQPRRGHHLVVEDGHRGDPEGQRHRVARPGPDRLWRAYLGRARHADQMHGAARLQPLLRGQLRVDDDTGWITAGRPPASEDPHPVGGHPEGAVRAGQRLQPAGQDAAPAGGGQLVDHLGGQRGDLR
jgi:hypothetical protein